MKVSAEVILEISDEERKRIAISYLTSLLPSEAEIREEGMIGEAWFTKIYDGHGKSVIKYEYFKPVAKQDRLVLSLLEELNCPF